MMLTPLSPLLWIRDRLERTTTRLDRRGSKGRGIPVWLCLDFLAMGWICARNAGSSILRCPICSPSGEQSTRQKSWQCVTGRKRRYSVAIRLRWENIPGFLQCFLPHCSIEKLQEWEIADVTYFHISDEPRKKILIPTGLPGNLWEICWMDSRRLTHCRVMNSTVTVWLKSPYPAIMRLRNSWSMGLRTCGPTIAPDSTMEVSNRFMSHAICKKPYLWGAIV